MSKHDDFSCTDLNKDEEFNKDVCSW